MKTFRKANIRSYYGLFVYNRFWEKFSHDYLQNNDSLKYNYFIIDKLRKEIKQFKFGVFTPFKNGAKVYKY